MATIYQNYLKNTADRRDLTSEEQARLRLAAASQQGAAQGAATGTTSVAPPAQAAVPDYVAASKARSAANQAIIGGATAGQTAPVQPTVTAGEQQLAAAAARANVMNNGTIAQQNAYREAEAKALNPFQEKLAQAAAAAPSSNPTNTAVTPAPTASQPAQMKDYTWYSWMGNNDMHTMNDEEKQKWNNAMAGYQLGDYRAFNQDFQTAGNWGSYIGDNGNVSGMLRYAGDGIGGYLPVNNGKVMAGLDPNHEYLFYGPGGEVYTVDANGNLTRSGNWTQEKPYSALENSIPYKLVKGTATDEERDQWYTQVDPSYPVRQAAANGDEDARQQLALLAQAEAARAGAPANNPSASGTGAPAQNAYQRTLEQATQPTAQPAQNAPMPTQRGNADYYAGAETPYQAAIGEWEYGPAPQWENSEYQRQRDEALRRAQNMRFSYDPESDPVWQAYQKQYRREGQRAMQDTMAEAAMRTGGLANSYAVSAAAQAGNYYAAQLSDRLPQLYNDAYQRYLAEFQKQLGISDQYAGFDQTEYGRYADQLGQWNKDRSFDYGLYRDRVGDARYADELAYDRAWNEENRDYSRNYQAQRDAISDQRYDQEWAQQLREYADQQNWKATEWQQYLREYGDKMSQQEREWAYQQYRDAVGDQQYADQTAWNRATYGQEYADSRADTEWEQGYKDNVFQNQVKQQDIDNAWARIKATGYISEEDAALLGIKPGEYTGSLTTGSKGTGGGGGNSGSGGSENGNGNGYDYAGTGGGSGGGYTGDAKTVVKGVIHDTNAEPMTTGFKDWWPTLRDAFDAGASSQELAQAIDTLYRNGIIAEYEIDVLLDKLGLDAKSGMTQKVHDKIYDTKQAAKRAKSGDSAIDNLTSRIKSKIAEAKSKNGG